MKAMSGDWGWLTVIGFAGVDRHRQATWRCICKCAKETTVSGSDLRQHKIVSCGCFRRAKAAETMRRNQRATRNHAIDRRPEEVRVWSNQHIKALGALGISFA